MRSVRLEMAKPLKTIPTKSVRLGTTKPLKTILTKSIVSVAKVQDLTLLKKCADLFKNHIRPFAINLEIFFRNQIIPAINRTK